MAKKKKVCPEAAAAPHEEDDAERREEEEAANDDDQDVAMEDANEKKRKKPSATTAKAIKVPLPRELKAQLVLDWEQITLEPRKWVPLPRTPTVAQVLDEFVASRDANQHKKRWRELADSILIYFDKALPKILLYRYEREQFDALTAASSSREKSDFKPSRCYGCEHLLRLFAKLPELLVRSDLSPHEVGQVRSKLSDVFKFLVARKADFLLPHYQLREALLGREDDSSLIVVEEDDNKRPSASSSSVLHPPVMNNGDDDDDGDVVVVDVPQDDLDVPQDDDVIHVDT